MSKKHKTYTTEFKAEAIKLIEANQGNVSETALLHKPICKGFFSDIIFKKYMHVDMSIKRQFINMSLCLCVLLFSITAFCRV